MPVAGQAAGPQRAPLPAPGGQTESNDISMVPAAGAGRQTPRDLGYNRRGQASPGGPAVGGHLELRGRARPSRPARQRQLLWELLSG